MATFAVFLMQNDVRRYKHESIKVMQNKKLHFKQFV